MMTDQVFVMIMCWLEAREMCCCMIEEMLGTTFLQDEGQGLQPVVFESEKLSPTEQNYAMHER